MRTTNYNENKIERQKALKLLEVCKSQETEKMKAGAKYQRIDNKTLALRSS